MKKDVVASLIAGIQCTSASSSIIVNQVCPCILATVFQHLWPSVTNYSFLILLPINHVQNDCVNKEGRRPIHPSWGISRMNGKVEMFTV